MRPMKYSPGIKATEELSLRVSVATLVRVVFKHPVSDEWMLVLERKATLNETIVEVKSQPFGGAIRILDIDAIHDLIGDFHFDSERSRVEQDFRLFIRPLRWALLRDFCIQHLNRMSDPVLETDPARELAEEFEETLKVNLIPNQYELKPTGMVLEDKPTPTENVHSPASPTVRVYRIFEAVITDPSLITTVMKNSEDISNKALEELALADKEKGRKGWANSVLYLPLKSIKVGNFARSPKKSHAPILIEGNWLDEAVLAALEGITIPKYQRL